MIMKAAAYDYGSRFPPSDQGEGSIVERDLMELGQESWFGERAADEKTGVLLIESVADGTKVAAVANQPSQDASIRALSLSFSLFASLSLSPSLSFSFPLSLPLPLSLSIFICSYHVSLSMLHASRQAS